MDHLSTEARLLPLGAQHILTRQDKTPYPANRISSFQTEPDEHVLKYSYLERSDHADDESTEAKRKNTRRARNAPPRKAHFNGNVQFDIHCDDLPLTRPPGVTSPRSPEAWSTPDSWDDRRVRTYDHMFMLLQRVSHMPDIFVDNLQSNVEAALGVEPCSAELWLGLSTDPFVRSHKGSGMNVNLRRRIMEAIWLTIHDRAFAKNYRIAKPDLNGWDANMDDFQALALIILELCQSLEVEHIRETEAWEHYSNQIYALTEQVFELRSLLRSDERYVFRFFNPGFRLHSDVRPGMFSSHIRPVAFLRHGADDARSVVCMTLCGGLMRMDFRGLEKMVVCERKAAVGIYTPSYKEATLKRVFVSKYDETCVDDKALGRADLLAEEVRYGGTARARI